MEDNKIYFEIKDNRVTVSFKDKTLNISDFIQVVSTGILSAMLSVVQATPEGQRQPVKEALYDTYNMTASGVLKYFAPEIELRPNLTAQAILEAEDKIIEKEYNKTKVDPNYRSPIANKPKLTIIKN